MRGCRQGERLVPGDAPEPRLAALPEHRVGEASELSQARAVELAQGFDVPQSLRIERAHRVDLEEIEARRAEVDAVDRPVVEAGNAERATVADALAEDVPCVPGVALVLPHGLGHFQVVVSASAG